MPDVGKLQDFLEAAGAGPGHFYLLEGRGRVLAALPGNPPAFARTLALYRPQKALARTWIFWVRFLRCVGSPGVALKKWSWPGARRITGPCPGVLLGNPYHPVPRAIFLLQESGIWLVGKFIPDPNRQHILRREQDLLSVAAQHGGHAPRCLGWKACGQGGALWTEWLAPRPGNPRWQDRLRLLHDWLLPKPSRPLSDFPAWKETGDWAGGAGAVAQGASQIQLRPCLRHGDFAPWNLLQGPDGTWMAVDWEEGCTEDAPGLDLIHDLLQHEFLIRRTSFGQGRARMKKALQQPEIAKYLGACGWLGKETVLLEWAIRFEAQRRPEIKSWARAC